MFDMKIYKDLSDSEIAYFRGKLILPNENYPHYQPLIVDNITVQDYTKMDAINGEIFCESDFLKDKDSNDLRVSNYGRISYKSKIIKPFVVGTFLHCTKVYIKNHGEYYVYRMVKETFDPIENMYMYQVHHINNNALDNRPENLIWVTEDDHRKIDKEFNSKLRRISIDIFQKNISDLKELFTKNSEKIFSGKEILSIFPNVYAEVIKNNIYTLEEKRIILNISNKRNIIFKNKMYEMNILNKSHFT
jgi:hypothetical protein